MCCKNIYRWNFTCNFLYIICSTILLGVKHLSNTFTDNYTSDVINSLSNSMNSTKNQKGENVECERFRRMTSSTCGIIMINSVADLQKSLGHAHLSAQLSAFFFFFFLIFKQIMHFSVKIGRTRMHSSMMRTARLLTESQSVRGVCPGECLPRGGLPRGGVCPRGGGRHPSGPEADPLREQNDTQV